MLEVGNVKATTSGSNSSTEAMLCLPDDDPAGKAAQNWKQASKPWHGWRDVCVLGGRVEEAVASISGLGNGVEVVEGKKKKKKKEEEEG